MAVTKKMNGHKGADWRICKQWRALKHSNQQALHAGLSRQW